MQTQRWNRSVAPPIYNLGAECWVVNATPWSLYSREITAAIIVQGDGWTTVVVWTAVQNRMS
jgi:hypothetical protein